MPTETSTGPVTGPVITTQPTSPGPGIVSSSGVRSNFIQDSGVLNELAANDPYRVLVANQLATNAANQGVGISNATAAGANGEIQAEQAGHAYSEGVAKAGAESGLTRSAPEYSQGLLSEAASKEALNLQNLQEKEDLGVAKATAARQASDSSALKEAVSYVQSVRAAKATALQRLQEQSNSDRSYALQAAKFNQSGGAGRYNAKNIPDKVYSDLLSDLGGNATLTQLYGAYPDVDPTFVSSIYKSLHPITGGIVNPYTSTDDTDTSSTN